MPTYRQHWRRYGDQQVNLWQNTATGQIDKVIITDNDPVRGDEHGYGPVIELGHEALYALIDTVAATDPDTWAERFPSEEAS